MREESDQFGAVEISKDALYGIQTVRTMQNLSFSGRTLSQYSTYIESLALVKKAAALANQEAGIIDNIIGNAIMIACDSLIKGDYHEHFPIDILHGGGGIGTNMNMNEVIANLANELFGTPRGSYSPIHPADQVNASQSTSDVCHTAIRLAIMKRSEPLFAALDQLIEAIKSKAVEFQDVTTIARTCLQDGMRVQLGDTFSGYSQVINRRLLSLEEATSKLHFINLGGTVIGSGVGAPQAYRDTVVSKLCEVSGIDLAHRENLYDAAQNIDDLARVSSELRILASCLIKLAKDLRLLSSGPEAGFAEIQLPAVQAGSSFFPGKVNPVIPETLIQCCFQVIGCDSVVQSTLEHGELGLNVFEGAAGVNILDAMGMLEKALVTFTEKCIREIEANRERCEELSNSFIPLVVELKEKVGYTAAARLAKDKGNEEIKNLIQNGGFEYDTSNE
ncbi:lyase family protein [Neobacillus sp. PS2-9]|uniref:lyase family protein n=1 Tax=Neobacillus sp. PS2-9 TaxID=3070676 RepID=UPI0027E0CFD2|nr:lyase family protein [Neobacillus sp. PS2-9]WML58729.1 lyase family protein [Neobacillus sp. PS2-9]